jgi:Kef-type K+ transport system membrane component KefB
MDISILVPIILILTFFMGFIFKRVGLPPVVGQILAGILLGVPFLKTYLFDDPSSLVVVSFLAYLEIIFLSICCLISVQRYWLKISTSED